MEHEGPSPAFNSQKRDTAAEQLTKQQDEYEARGQPSSDKLQPVLTHNEKYPKLREELRRRQSDADVSDIDKDRTPHAPRSKKPSVQSGQTKRGRRNNNLTRVTKKRSNYCSCCKCVPSKIFSTKSCQFTNYVTVVNRRIGTEALAGNGAPVAPMAVSETLVELEPPKNEYLGSVPSSIKSHITTVSSLNSFYGMDQEPMDRS